MPAIYSDETLKIVWDMIEDEKMTRKKAAEALDTTPDKIDSIYEAARRRFAVKYTPPQKRCDVSAPLSLVSYKRPKAQYSNKSPYGIAQPGNNDVNDSN